MTRFSSIVSSFVIFCLTFTHGQRTRQQQFGRQYTAANFLVDDTNRLVIENQDKLDEYIETIGNISRPVGSPEHQMIQNFITGEMRSFGYTVETPTHEQPIVRVVGLPPKMTFTNLIGTLNPNAKKQLILACHYDTKYFNPKMSKQFKGAMDSAVPCAMILFIGRILAPYFQQHQHLSLQLIFFDGEEAFNEWTSTDSLYGSRQLAASWELEPHPVTRGASKLDGIEAFILLDLLGIEMGCSGRATMNVIKSLTKDHSNTLLAWQNLFARMGRLEEFSEGCTPYFASRGFDYGIADDHVPFQQRGVKIVHLIGNPFPSVWHKLGDNLTAVKRHDVRNIVKILTTFVRDFVDTTNVRIQHAQQRVPFHEQRPIQFG